MEYDRGDGFLFDFESNGIPFQLSPRSYIPFNLKGNRDSLISNKSLNVETLDVDTLNVNILNAGTLV